MLRIGLYGDVVCVHNAALSYACLERWVMPEAITLDVIRFGFEQLILDEHQVVALVVKRMNAGLPQHEVEVALALLLRDEYSRVAELLGAAGSMDDAYARRVWAFAALKSTRDRWATLAYPWVEVADVLEGLNRPEPFIGLVYYDPVPFFRRAPGKLKMLARLDAVLASESAQIGLCP